MKKDIILDLDGVIADIDTAISEYLHYDCGISFDYSKWLTTDTKDEEALHLFSNKIFWKNIKPFEDAWTQINYWFSSGIDVHVLTARRSPASVDAAIPWLNNWNINTTIPKFSLINEKHKIAKEINPIYMVEDNPNEVIILREHGVNCFLRKAWYNKSYWNDMPCIDTLYDLNF